MNVALVYDRVNKWGGAERVLLALHRIWPDAPLFTAVYDQKHAAWADVFTVRPSVLQRIPFARYVHESLALVTPIAFESFSFDGYDVVISVTSAEAKNIITKPGTVHICYCLTPTRYLWSGYEHYKSQPGLGYASHAASLGLRLFGATLRRWDEIAAQRPDYYIAISEHVKARIHTYYHRGVSEVIYPPVDTTKFVSHNLSSVQKKKQNYFLTVSRLVSYKRVDLLIQAFNELQLPLVIIGDGHQKKELQQLGGTTITFVDRHLTDSELVGYYEGCRAFVYAADEDFGLAAVEAQACGTPVIAYKESGIAEVVRDSVTGILFGSQTADAIIRAVRLFEKKTFSSAECRKQAIQMSEPRFMKEMESVVSRLVKESKL